MMNGSQGVPSAHGLRALRNLRDMHNGYDDDVDVIARSGLFDSAWYIAHNPDVASSGMDPLQHYVLYGCAEGRLPFQGFDAQLYLQNVGMKDPVTRNPLAHYILLGGGDKPLEAGLLSHFSMRSIRTACDRLSKLPIFGVEDYLKLNEDVRAVDRDGRMSPTNHAMVYGFPEGRRVFMQTTVAHVLGSIERMPHSAQPAVAAASTRMLPPIGVFYSSVGNVFIREIAQDLVDTLILAGQNARLLDENASLLERPKLCIFVAPHEFFHIGAGREWAIEPVIKKAFMYTTEQPQTLWFERSMPYVLMSKGVVDVSAQVAELLGRSGMPVCHFNPSLRPRSEWLIEDDLTHPLIRTLPKSAAVLRVPNIPIFERPLDISFFGSESEHRDSFFLRNAETLSTYSGFIYYRKTKGPLTDTGLNAALARIAGHVSAHSKIYLNLHRDSNGFFEWHRIVRQGMVAGSVVVSEPCPPHPQYKVGVHYLEESGRHIFTLIDWLLRDPEGQLTAQKIQDNVVTMVADQEIALANAQMLVNFLGQTLEEASE